MAPNTASRPRSGPQQAPTGPRDALNMPRGPQGPQRPKRCLQDAPERRPKRPQEASREAAVVYHKH
eukprot:4308906-Pyramimonas_sp.AAC.1